MNAFDLFCLLCLNYVSMEAPVTLNHHLGHVEWPLQSTQVHRLIPTRIDADRFAIVNLEKTQKLHFAVRFTKWPSGVWHSLSPLLGFFLSCVCRSGWCTLFLHTFFCLTRSLSHRTNTTIKRDKNTLKFSQRRKNLIVASATLPAWSRLRRHPSWHHPLSERFVFSFVSFVFVLALVLLHGMTRRVFFFSAATNYHSVGDFSLRPKNDKMVLEVSSSTSSPSSRRNGVPLISLTNYSSAQTKTISRRWLVCSLTHAHFNHRHMRFPDWIVIHSISSSTVFVKS